MRLAVLILLFSVTLVACAVDKSACHLRAPRHPGPHLGIDATVQAVVEAALPIAYSNRHRPERYSPRQVWRATIADLADSNPRPECHSPGGYWQSSPIAAKSVLRLPDFRLAGRSRGSTLEYSGLSWFAWCHHRIRLAGRAAQDAISRIWSSCIPLWESSSRTYLG